MNQKEEENRKTINELTAIASEASRLAVNASNVANNQANVRIWGIMAFVMLGFLVSVIVGRNNAAERDRKLFLTQVWAMSTHYHTSSGRRYTWEYGQKVFDANPDLVRPEPDYFGPIPSVVPWSDLEYQTFVETIESNPDLLNDQEELVKVYLERIRQAEHGEGG